MKVLLVDDEPGFLGVMGDLLKQIGCTVFQAGDGKQAREFLEQESVDLVISDVFMPTLDGVRFHSYVRDFSENPEVPFIFMSGYDDEQTRNLVVDPRLDFFFSKTAPIEDVLEHVKGLKAARAARTK
jgi:DNA-binding response OmpR family regulator